MKKKKKCLRCGQCCFFLVDNVVRRCRFLVSLPSGKTLCRVYNGRKGHTIYRGETKTILCVECEELPFDFEGCPFNTGKPTKKYAKEVLRRLNRRTRSEI